MIDIRRCTVDELEATPNFQDVLDEYALESSLPELGPAQAQLDTYRRLEASGMFHPIGAFEDGRLIGLILPLVVNLPHYGVVAATVESFFVPAADRPKGVGMFLLHKAEALAKELGAKALILSAPTGSVLARVMYHCRDYRLSNEVFIKALA